jgi:hypothetical protein
MPVFDEPLSGSQLQALGSQKKAHEGRGLAEIESLSAACLLPNCPVAVQLASGIWAWIAAFRWIHHENGVRQVTANIVSDWESKSSFGVVHL